MADVVKLQAAFEILDEATPALESIEAALVGLERTVGVSREEVVKYRKGLEDLSKQAYLTEQAIETLGISTEEYNKILANKKALEEAEAAMSKLHAEAMEMNKEFDRGRDPVTNFGIAIAGEITAKITQAAGKVKNFATESMDLAVRLEMLENVSRKLGETQGYTAKQIDDLADKIAKQGITSIKSREAINKMVQAGLDLSRATKLARLAQDAGTVGNINSSEAMGRLIHGITTMQTETLRGIGININMQKAQQEYAKSLNVATSALTPAQKQQAMMNAVLKEGEKIHGSYETRMGTAGGAALSLARVQEEAMVKLGNSLKPLKELEIQLETMFWKNVQKYPEAWTAVGAAVLSAGSVIALGMGSWTKGLDLIMGKTKMVKDALLGLIATASKVQGSMTLAQAGTAVATPASFVGPAGGASAGGAAAAGGMAAAGAAAVAAGLAIAKTVDVLTDFGEESQRAENASLQFAKAMMENATSTDASKRAIWDNLTAQQKLDAQLQVTRANLEEATANVGLFEGGWSLLKDAWDALEIGAFAEKWGILGHAVDAVLFPFTALKSLLEVLGGLFAEARLGVEILAKELGLFEDKANAARNAATQLSNQQEIMKNAAKLAGHEFKTLAEAQEFLKKHWDAEHKAAEQAAKDAETRRVNSKEYQDQLAKEMDAAMKKAIADEKAADMKKKVEALSKKLGRTVSEEEVKAVEAAEKAEKAHEAQMKKSASAAETYAKKIRDLAASFTGNKAQETVRDIGKALQEVKGGFDSLEGAAKTNIAKSLADAAEAGATLPPELKEIADAYVAMSAAAEQAQKNLAELRKEQELQKKFSGAIDKEDFARQKKVLDEMAGSLGEDAGISAVGFIPPDQVQAMAEFFQKGKEGGETLSKAQELVIQRWEEMRAATQAEQDAVEAFGKAGAKTMTETEEKSAKLARTIQAVSEGLLILGDLLGGVGGDIAGMLSASIQGWQQYGDRVKDLNEAVASGKMTQAAADAEKFQMKVGLAANAAGMLGNMLGKSTNPNVQKLGGALQGAAAGAKLGSAFGPWGTAIGAVGGAIVGFLSKAKKMREEMKKLKKEFIESHGGMEKLAEEAKNAGVNVEKAFKAKTPEQLKKQLDEVNKQLEAFNGLLEMSGGSMEGLKQHAADAGISLQEIWDAKTPEEYLAAVEKVKKGLGDWDKANEKLNAAMDKYGITIDQLGPKFRQAGFDKMGMELLESFSLLKAAGVDVSLITEKMSEDMSDYVNRAVAAGSTIPQAMKPMIDEMIKNGDLLDENGEAYESLEDAGITFAQTLEEGIASAVKAIEELVAVLAQGFNIPVNVHAGNGGGGGGTGAGGGGGRGEPVDADHSFAEGSGGFRDFGTGTKAVLHGTEAVVTPGNMFSLIKDLMSGALEKGGVTGKTGDVSTVVNLAISENPMQTAETVEQMRSFTLETVQKEVARSLADAIAEGKA